jgi:flagellar biogenesis protein FliO
MFPDLGASRRRGITVLTLLLIIIAIVVAAVFLVRYLRNRPAVSHTPPPVTASIA